MMPRCRPAGRSEPILRAVQRHRQLADVVGCRLAAPVVDQGQRGGFRGGSSGSPPTAAVSSTRTDGADLPDKQRLSLADVDLTVSGRATETSASGRPECRRQYPRGPVRSTNRFWSRAGLSPRTASSVVQVVPVTSTRPSEKAPDETALQAGDRRQQAGGARARGSDRDWRRSTWLADPAACRAPGRRQRAPGTRGGAADAAHRDRGRSLRDHRATLIVAGRG
jgi:hypothetical protein